MKKIFLGMLLFFCSCVCFAAKKSSPIAKVSTINFYGVDYTKCRAAGLEGTPEQISKALTNINDLFVTEAKKYDVAKMTKKKVGVVDTKVAAAMCENMNADSLLIQSTGNKLSSEVVESTIKNLNLKETKGTGLLLIGEYLNKSKSEGSYRVVFFDIESRSIIAQWEATGKAGGFGLRNFWAKSVYLVMDAIKSYKE